MSVPDYTQSHEGESMFHHLMHRFENFGAPIVVAVLTWVSNIPPLQILGAIVSFGWFVLACVRERRLWLERGDRRRFPDKSAGTNH